MSKTDDKESALVRASFTAPGQTGSQALARRGLHDLEFTEQKVSVGKCCPKDEAKLLFCLDHHCAHNRCPNVMHLDFALVPFTKQGPESLRRLITRGPLAQEYRNDARFLFCLDHQCTHNWCPNVPHMDFALVSLKSIDSETLQRSITEGPLGWDERSPQFFHAREYWVLQTDARWLVLEDSKVAWEPQPPRQDGTSWLKAPQGLRGPFFTISEAWQFAEEKTLGGQKVLTLPRLVPHAWSSDARCSFCGESNTAQHGQPCPRRSCYTWYGVLGVSGRADRREIEDAYRELTEELDHKRLYYREDIRREWGEYGYPETQLQWFNAAHAVLGDPLKRQQYDAELWSGPQF